MEKKIERWADFFFAQESGADEYLDFYDKKGASKLIGLLIDSGCEAGDVWEPTPTNPFPWGKDDKIQRSGGYMVTINRGIPYIGVSVLVKV